MGKKPVYRFVTLTRAPDSVVCEVLHRGKLVHTTATFATGAAAYSAAISWVAARGKQPVPESTR